MSSLSSLVLFTPEKVRGVLLTYTILFIERLRIVLFNVTPVIYW